MTYQISAGEMILFIGLMINALAVFLTAFVQHSRVNKVIANVEKIELSTNSMKDEMLHATREAALMQGKQEGAEAALRQGVEIIVVKEETKHEIKEAIEPRKK